MKDTMGPNDRVVGLDLGGTKVFGALVDVEGRLEHETYVAHGGGTIDADGTDRAFDALVALSKTLASKAHAAGQHVRGFGVGAPGITRSNGVVVAAPALGWTEFPLAQRLAERLDLSLDRVKADNDVNLAALGEMRFGAGRGARDLVCVSPGTGIGGAVIIDGKLLRGRNEAAGEMGLFLPGTQFLSWRNKDWGPLEDVASGTGIATRARQHAEATGMTMPEGGLRSEHVFAAAAAGAAWAKAILDETLDHFAVLIANIQAILDPERIVMGGGISGAADWIIPGIVQRLTPVIPNVPHIVLSQLGYRAGVLGAAVSLSAV